MSPLLAFYQHGEASLSTSRCLWLTSLRSWKPFQRLAISLLSKHAQPPPANAPAQNATASICLHCFVLYITPAQHGADPCLTKPITAKELGAIYSSYEPINPISDRTSSNNQS
jgi:hypothetical protein